MSLDDIYTREWFEHDFADLQPEFDVVADAIYRQFGPQFALDVGCGPGMVVRQLRERGVEAYGIDGSQHAIDYAHPSVRGALRKVDINFQLQLHVPMEHVGGGVRMIWQLPTRDGLVICTEVAEHLAPEHADHLVKLLCSAMCPIVFTAAPPGQGGHHHVNCQESGYWVDKFNNHGAILDIDATHELERRWGNLNRLSHMAKNVMVFR